MDAERRSWFTSSALATLGFSLPAVAASLGIVLVLMSFIGGAAPLAVPAWVVAGLCTLTPVGERIALRCSKWSRPDSARWLILQPVAASILTRCRLESSQIDWYVAPGIDLNAFATGRRSVAVTQGVLDGLDRHRITSREVEAILVHEIGHLRQGDTTYSLALRCWTSPWRSTLQPVARSVARALGRTRIQMIMTGAVLITATAQRAGAGAWFASATLAVTAPSVVLLPMMVARTNRRRELQADTFAGEHGLGRDLAAVLQSITAPGEYPSARRRLLRSHPDAARRTANLGSFRPFELDDRRGMDYHRRRPQCVQHISPRQAVITNASGVMTVRMFGAQPEIEPDAELVHQVVAAAIDDLRHTMREVRLPVPKAIRAEGIAFIGP